MHLIARLFPVAILATCFLALTACGGGGSGAVAEQKSVVDPYVGTWSVCHKSQDPGQAWLEQYTIRKQTATTGEFEARIFDFANDECRGDPQGWNAYRETIEWTGETQAIDGLTAHRVLLKSGTHFSHLAPTEVPTDPVTTEYQVVAVVNGNQLRIGEFKESNLQTYPQHLWSEVLQRQ